MESFSGEYTYVADHSLSILSAYLGTMHFGLRILASLRISAIYPGMYVFRYGFNLVIYRCPDGQSLDRDCGLTKQTGEQPEQSKSPRREVRRSRWRLAKGQGFGERRRAKPIAERYPKGSQQHLEPGSSCARRPEGNSLGVLSGVVPEDIPLGVRKRGGVARG